MKKSKVNLNFLKKNMKEKETHSAVENEDLNNEAELESQESQPELNVSTEDLDQLAKLEAELSATKDKYLRLGADFENYKKRVSKDRIDLVKMAGADVLVSILP